jgi:hypothetical protein
MGQHENARVAKSSEINKLKKSTAKRGKNKLDNQQQHLASSCFQNINVVYTSFKSSKLNIQKYY